MEYRSNEENRIRAKIPGDDTGIIIKNSFCDICSPGPGCGVRCYVKDGKVIKIEGRDGHPAGKGVMCTKGLAGRQYVYREDRLKTPLRRTGKKGEGLFEEISWEEAFDEICEKLRKTREEYGASAVAFYSGYNKWYRPFLQRLAYSFGSVNYGSESSTCFNAAAMSWKAATGHDSVTPDRKNAGTFLGWSYNPYYSRNLGAPPAGGRKGKEKVIIVDPRITPAVGMEADLHLRLIPGTDGALAAAIARELIARDLIDHEYIKEHVYGFEDYKKYVDEYTPEKAQEITGVPAESIREAAAIIGENPPLCINQSASAYVHSKNGFQGHRAVQALCALMGSFDVKGGMIPAPDTLSHVRAGFKTNIEKFEWEKYPKDAPLPVGGETYPLWHRLVGECQACSLPDAVLKGKPYPVRAMVAQGMNFRMFNADKEMEQALKELDFFVDTDLFLTDSAKYADIVLPCRSSFERDELKVYGGGFAQYYEAAIEPFGEAKPDDEIIFELARRLDVDDELLKAGRDACYEYIFAGTGLELEELKKDRSGPLKLTKIKRIAPGDSGFLTPTGRFEIKSAVMEEYEGMEPLPVYEDSITEAEKQAWPLILVSGGRIPNALHSRLHDVPWLRSLRPEPMAEMNPEDAGAAGIADGDIISITTVQGAITVKVLLTPTVHAGTIHMYHGYREADVNSIIPKDNRDPYSGYPGFKCTPCRVEKYAAGAAEKCEAAAAGNAGNAQAGCGNAAPAEKAGQVIEGPAQEAGKEGGCILKFDAGKCTGCGACAIACMDQNDIDVKNGQKPYRNILMCESGCAAGGGIIKSEEVSRTFISSACRHCAEPACEAACPMNCFFKDEETGLVLYDNKACIGCGKCEKACPFSAISFRKTEDGKRKMEKCDGCIERLKAGLRPACERNCPTGALSILCK